MARPHISYNMKHTSRHGTKLAARHPQTSADELHWTRRHVGYGERGEHLTLRPVRGTGPLLQGARGLGIFRTESPACLRHRWFLERSGRNATFANLARCSGKSPSRAPARAPARPPSRTNEPSRYLGPGPRVYGDHVHHRASLELFVQFDKSTGCCERIAWRKFTPPLTADAGQSTPALAASRPCCFSAAFASDCHHCLKRRWIRRRLEASAALGCRRGIYDASAGAVRSKPKRKRSIRGMRVTITYADVRLLGGSAILKELAAEIGWRSHPPGLPLR